MFLDNFVQANFLFQFTFIGYLMAGLLYSVGLLRKNGNLTRAAFIILIASFVLNTGVIGQRWMDAGRAPFKTLYETMIFYPWCVTIVYLLLWGFYRIDTVAPFVSVVNIIGLAYATYRPDIEIINLPPALQSGWFVPHVVTYFIAYGALFSSFSLAVLYLKFPGWQREGTAVGFDELQKHAMDLGFVALTLGLVMGSFWGKVAWGDYWGWDPKENWALITWFIYLIAMHLRLIRGWKGKRAAFLNVAGFVAVIFTYLGMSMLPTAASSLHVYQ